MISDGTYEVLECGLSDDKHFLQDPVALTCGDCACKSCVKNRYFSEPIKCKICTNTVQKEYENAKPIKAVQQMIEKNAKNLLVIIEKQLTKSLAEFNGIYWKIDIAEF